MKVIDKEEKQPERKKEVNKMIRINKAGLIVLVIGVFLFTEMSGAWANTITTVEAMEEIMRAPGSLEAGHQKDLLKRIDNFLDITPVALVAAGYIEVESGLFVKTEGIASDPFDMGSVTANVIIASKFQGSEVDVYKVVEEKHTEGSFVMGEGFNTMFLGKPNINVLSNRDNAESPFTITCTGSLNSLNIVTDNQDSPGTTIDIDTDTIGGVWDRGILNILTHDTSSGDTPVEVTVKLPSEIPSDTKITSYNVGKKLEDGEISISTFVDTKRSTQVTGGFDVYKRIDINLNTFVAVETIEQGLQSLEIADGGTYISENDINTHTEIGGLVNLSAPPQEVNVGVNLVLIAADKKEILLPGSETITYSTSSSEETSIKESSQETATTTAPLNVWSTESDDTGNDLTFHWDDVRADSYKVHVIREKEGEVVEDYEAVVSGTSYRPYLQKNSIYTAEVTAVSTETSETFSKLPDEAVKTTMSTLAGDEAEALAANTGLSLKGDNKIVIGPVKVGPFNQGTVTKKVSVKVDVLQEIEAEYGVNVAVDEHTHTHTIHPVEETTTTKEIAWSGTDKAWTECLDPSIDTEIGVDVVNTELEQSWIGNLLDKDSEATVDIGVRQNINFTAGAGAEGLPISGPDLVVKEDAKLDIDVTGFEKTTVIQDVNQQIEADFTGELGSDGPIGVVVSINLEASESGAQGTDIDSDSGYSVSEEITYTEVPVSITENSITMPGAGSSREYKFPIEFKPMPEFKKIEFGDAFGKPIEFKPIPEFKKIEFGAEVNAAETVEGADLDAARETQIIVMFEEETPDDIKAGIIDGVGGTKTRELKIINGWVITGDTGDIEGITAQLNKREEVKSATLDGKVQMYMLADAAETIEEPASDSRIMMTRKIVRLPKKNVIMGDLPSHLMTSSVRRYPTKKAAISPNPASWSNYVFRTVPSRDVSSVSRVIPSRDVSSVSRVIPRRDVSSVSRVIPRRDVSSVSRVIPGRDVSSVRRVIPSRDVSSVSRVIPSRDVSSVSRVIPGRDVSSVRRVIPSSGTRYIPKQTSTPRERPTIRLGRY